MWDSTNETLGSIHGFAVQDHTPQRIGEAPFNHPVLCGSCIQSVVGCMFRGSLGPGYSRL